MAERKVLTLPEAREIARDFNRLAELIGRPYEDWHERCHEISLRLLRTGEFGHGRIARGTAEGVPGQHSWIVLGHDVYDPGAVIVDPTLKLWLGSQDKDDDEVAEIYTCIARHTSHRPHGAGSIWEWGRPENGSGKIIELTPSFELSRTARAFLDVLGPLDRQGWAILCHAPVQEWPSDEIIAAIDDTEEIRALIPIDILGHITDRNPGGLYLADKESE